MNQKTFPNDDSFTHLEIGAGCGNFGKNFYPKCYLTDKDENLEGVCAVCYIDWFCDAHELPWGNNRFDKIIICNPYGYGFHDDEGTALLLKELLRALKGKGSEIIMLCNVRNKYCNPKRVETRVKTFLEYNESPYLRVVCQDIVANVEYPNHVFQLTIGGIAIPSSKITIHVES